VLGRQSKERRSYPGHFFDPSPAFGLWLVTSISSFCSRQDSSKTFIYLPTPNIFLLPFPPSLFFIRLLLFVLSRKGSID
jgi:hypothetical protein